MPLNISLMNACPAGTASPSRPEVVFGEKVAPVKPPHLQELGQEHPQPQIPERG
jgi:hypothetical protein